MPDCQDLTPQECDYLKALAEVARKHRKVARNFQLAHRMVERVQALGPDEVLMMEKVPHVPGGPKFQVTKQKRPKAVAGAGADPCCYWEWVCIDPEDPNTCDFICVGGC